MRRKARSGSRAVRWAYGVFLTLFVALTVLVHHETAALGASSAMPASSMAAMDASPMTGAPHATHVMPGAAAPTAWRPSSAHSLDPGGCSDLGMQHCTTASIASVQLAAPAENDFSLLADLRRDETGMTPAGAVGRAPPDRSVLLPLRI